ncbi:MAG: hypothetical protein KAT69_01715 [Candidatus Aminicenantes bacterium]|nr:hypothetical protein [Candidatus Aminicenantes bacterium]
MAGDKKIKCEVVHPKLNLRVDGKLQRVPVGTELMLTEAQLEAFGPRKMRKAGKKQVIGDSGDGETDIKKMKVDELKAKLDELKVEYLGDAKKDDLIVILENHLSSQQ